MEDFPTALFSALEEDLRNSCPTYRGAPWSASLGGASSLRDAASASISSSLLKKLSDRERPDAESAAIDKFLACNDRCKGWSPTPTRMLDEYLLGEFRRSVYSLFSNYRLPFRHTRCGPGSALGATGTNFYSKFWSSPLGMTHDGLYALYRAYVNSISPEMALAESNRLTALGNRVFESSRLTTVPKTWEIRRTICVEPSLNMSYQLMIGDGILDILRYRFGIDLADQPTWNRMLARIGSETDEFGTIDLASASDSISSDMVSWCLRDNGCQELYSWLQFARCPSTNVNGSEVQLHMLSSMGNGFTFPLQTALFVCVVEAVYRLLELTPRFRSQQVLRDGRWIDLEANAGVFGDDIVVRREAYDLVCRLLHLLGFTVNGNKSFNEGYFRESCGHDYFRGHNVRGIYLKSLLTPQSRITAVNQLTRWSVRQGIPLLNTIATLLNSVENAPIVPLHEMDDSGIKSPCALMRNGSLRGIHPSAYKSGTYRYTAWHAKERFLFISDGQVKSPRWHKRQIYNGFGHLDAILQGCVTGRRISIRGNAVRYGQVSRTTPAWDASFSPQVSDSDTFVSWANLTETMVFWASLYKETEADPHRLTRDEIADMDSLLFMASMIR